MMVERYLNHLIFVKADQDPATGLWTAGTHVQFNEDPRTFRDVWLPRPNIGLRTKKSAEKQMMKEAKKWVDGRLREENQATSKPVSPGSNLAANEPNTAQPHEEKDQTSYTSSPRAN
jgi:hypothetical protein